MVTHRSFFHAFAASAVLAAVSAFVLLACDKAQEPATTKENTAAATAVDSAGPRARGGDRRAARQGDRRKPHRPQSVDDVMARFDANGDDRITREEVSQGRGRYRAERFPALDADGDGKLTEAEAGPHKWRWMEAADTDGDGAVTLDELQQADDKSELGAHPGGKASEQRKAGRGSKGRTAGGPYKGHDPILRYDRDGDHVVTREEVALGMARQRTGAPR